ncbi:MAG: hypothetical protein KAR83_04355 [Thermodesulfovibrionales bacterium]|nr:hypothetical protein [Thermodesulfovibrionales bacterium]
MACALFIFFVVIITGCEKASVDTANVCSFLKGPCTARSGELDVSLMITPAPVPSMKDLRFVVELSGPDTASTATVRLGLEMPGMYMGENIITLEDAGGGRYEGSGIIPTCPSGKRLWSALVSVVPEEGRIRSAEFLFEVAR